MKKVLPLLPLFALLALACNKDKFTSVPQLKIKSIRPSNEIVQRDIVELKGSFTDDEGDLDSALIVYKWYNGANVARQDTFRYSIESLGQPVNTREGDLILKFQFASNEPYDPPIVQLPAVIKAVPMNKDTTATLGLIIIDKKKQRSQYGESDQVRLKKP